ncbi:hypothetical protein L1987_54580 [Smallanthus sonchifolius]|uniref:Uncharacterized protein n=1 Tax=Smallanthus sonchifolius TaxID=185202 RepID=A0ACB9E7I2_9ASTR|nr:hypothetical protein L1987_54580 [Smallanthus sonchifolius]
MLVLGGVVRTLRVRMLTLMRCQFILNRQFKKEVREAIKKEVVEMIHEYFPDIVKAEFEELETRVLVEVEKKKKTTGTGGNCDYGHFKKCDPPRFYGFTLVELSEGKEDYSMTWEDLKGLVRKQFCAPGELERVEREFLTLKAGKATHSLPDHVRHLFKALQPSSFHDAVELSGNLYDDVMGVEVQEKKSDDKK